MPYKKSHKTGQFINNPRKTLSYMKNNAKKLVLPTDFAPAERTYPATLLRQHQAWIQQEQTHLIGDAVPNVVLVLNNTRQNHPSSGYSWHGVFDRADLSLESLITHADTDLLKKKQEKRFENT